MWYLTMHSSKFFHIHLHFFPSNIMEQHIPFITTNPSAHGMDHTLSFSKQSSQVLYFELFPVLIPYLFFIWRVAAELNLNSAPSLSQTPLKYSLYALFLLPLLPFPSTQCKLIDSLRIKAKQ